MKRLIVLMVCVSALFTAVAQNPETMIFSVRGTDTLRLDYYKTTVTDAPCVVFLFGGGFYTGTRNKREYIDFCTDLTKRGIAAVSIDYRLGLKKLASSGEKPSVTEFAQIMDSTIDIAVEDLYAATSYLVANAATLGINPSQIYACGSSAGAVTVLTGEWRAANGNATLPDDFKYAGIISFAGAVYTNNGTPEWNSLPCPIMLFHGSADSNVPYDKLVLGKRGLYGSAWLADTFDKISAPYAFCSFTGSDHGIAVSPMRRNREQIAAFVHSPFTVRHMAVRTTYTDLDKPKFKGKIGLMDYLHSNFGKQTPDK